MSTTSLQLIAEKLDSLPEPIQELLASGELGQTLFTIGNKYGLHLDVGEELSDEVNLVLLGETHTDEFIDHLAKRLALPREKAAQIAADINQEVFLKVREALKELREGSKEKAEAAPAPTEPQPSRSTVLEGIENPEMASLAGDFGSKAVPGPSKEQQEILKSIEHPEDTPNKGEEVQHVPPSASAVPAPKQEQPVGTKLPLAEAEEGAPYGEAVLPKVIPGETVHERPVPIKIEVAA
ncbi:MAG: hypothetical protein V4674_01790, partial [Patescibacteria group bacterium]